jgi:sugar-phosphatase
VSKIAFLFDLDGTLVNSQVAVHESWMQIADEAGFHLPNLDGMHGLPAAVSLKKLMPDRADEEITRWAKRLERVEIVAAHSVFAVDGAIELLSNLSTLQIPWTIVTSCTMDLARARAGAAGISMPEHSVTFDQVTHGKPNPEPFLLGAERLGVPAEICWGIEDAPGGVRAAKSAGCTVAAVLTTHSEDELLEADHHLESLDQLMILCGLVAPG